MPIIRLLLNSADENSPVKSKSKRRRNRISSDSDSDDVSEIKEHNAMSKKRCENHEPNVANKSPPAPENPATTPTTNGKAEKSPLKIGKQ